LNGSLERQNRKKKKKKGLMADKNYIADVYLQGEKAMGKSMLL